MVSKGQYVHAKVYESSAVEIFAQSDKDEAQRVRSISLSSNG